MSVDKHKMEVDQPECRSTNVDPAVAHCGDQISHNNNNNTFISTNNHETPGNSTEEQIATPLAYDATAPVLKSEPQSMIRKTTVLFKPYLDAEPQSDGSRVGSFGEEAERLAGGAATSALGASPVTINSTFNHYNVSPTMTASFWCSTLNFISKFTPQNSIQV